MTNENQTDEVIEEVVEEVIPDSEIELDPVTKRMFQNAKIGPYAETDETEEVVAEEAAEETVEETTPEPEEDSVTLPDGTVVTIEELGKGYLRQGDYTKKTQGLADERKVVENSKALLDYIQNDPDLRQKVIQHMSGNNTPEIEKPKGIEVPENYKDDPFVTQLVSVVNELKGDVTQVKGGYQNITQETKAQQEQSAFMTKLNTSLESAYTGLKGQVETPPTPQEFTSRIEAYFVENNIDPGKGAHQIVNSVDPNYLPGMVERIFKADIQDATKAETKVVEKNRTKRTAKGATLRVAGKSTQTPKPSLPKLPTGKLDRDALMRNIIIEQNKQPQG